MDEEPQFWRSLNDGGPYKVRPILLESWVTRMSPKERARCGIYESEADAVDRAIRDNQKLAHKTQEMIANLKVRKAVLKEV